MHDAYPQIDHERAFERAWSDPKFTRFELPPVDVNRVLAERYRLDRPLAFTGAMLWDMETRKARRPDLYIPYVVEAGSADAWADAKAADGADTFVRKSRQRLWLQPERYELILEQTRLDHAKRRVTFIGAREYPGRDGERLQAGRDQPIFHVVHGVDGDEDRPLNQWLIVFETASQDSRLLAPFVRMAGDVYLPGYVEVYIREQLGVGLERIG
jgi:hypothetical protein